MSTEELLEKTVDTSDLAAGGLLNAEQADKFVDFVVDQSVMIKDARVIRMRAPETQVDKVATTGRVSKPKTEGVAPASLSEPSFGKVTLSCVGVITPFEVTYEALEDNIEGESAEDTLVRVMATQTASDLEELAIQGDTASGDSYLALLDGWRKLADDGHIVDQGGVAVDKAMFNAMIKALPEKYQRNWQDLRFYLAPSIAQDYRATLSESATVIGEKYLLENAPLTVFGIPVVSVPMIPTNLDGIAPVTGTDYSFAFLTPRRNLLWGVHREIRIDKDKDIMRGVNQYAITTRVACEFEEDDAVVVAINIAQA
ncbi:MAG: phage major capsid protein [Armatimonadota bacterium]